MKTTRVLCLAFLALGGCDRTRHEPFAPAREVQPGQGFRYDDLHGSWTVNRTLTDEANGDRRFKPLPSMEEAWRFERNGVVGFERLGSRRAGTWKLDGPDRLTVQHPDQPVPDHYIVEFHEGLMRLRNRQTGQWVVLERAE